MAISAEIDKTVFVSSENWKIIIVVEICIIQTFFFSNLIQQIKKKKKHWL